MKPPMYEQSETVAEDLPTLVLHHFVYEAAHSLRFFFFDLGFTALSRIFHLYRAGRSSKVGENRRTRRKTT